MSYTQWNGRNLIPTPSSPAPRQIDFTMNESVAVNQSPFTLQSQVLQWPGADWWEATVTFAPMTRDEAAPWLAFLAALRGRAGVFHLGDTLGATPQGSNLYNGSNVELLNPIVAGQTVISTMNWRANQNGVLLPGDYIMLFDNPAFRLHRYVGQSPLNSDGSGHATMEIWPSVRTACPAGYGVYTSNTVGLWQLADNKRQWTINEQKLYTISMKLIEAR